MQSHEKHMTHQNYGRFAIEMSIDFIIMYLVMYTMIATLDHFYFNINSVYMTLMMVAPMSIVMLVSMRSMFPSQAANWAIVAVATAALTGSFAAMRTQAAVGDAQFLKSMIPHHSGAILMCERSAITDRAILDLCKGIIESQTKEIAQMQEILQRY